MLIIDSLLECFFVIGFLLGVIFFIATFVSLFQKKFTVSLMYFVASFNAFFSMLNVTLVASVTDEHTSQSKYAMLFVELQIIPFVFFAFSVGLHCAIQKWKVEKKQEQ